MCRYLTSCRNISRRINAIAIFQMIPQIKDKEVFAACLPDFLKVTIPELIISLENGNHPPVVNDQKVVEGIIFYKDRELICD